MLQDVIHAPPQQPQPPLPEEELANIVMTTSSLNILIYMKYYVFDIHMCI